MVEAVADLRMAGFMWREIGDLAGVSAQDAHQRWSEQMPQTPVPESVAPHEWRGLCDKLARVVALLDSGTNADTEKRAVLRRDIEELSSEIDQEKAALFERLRLDRRYHNLYVDTDVVLVDQYAASVVLWSRDGVYQRAAFATEPQSCGIPLDDPRVPSRLADWVRAREEWKR